MVIKPNQSSNVAFESEQIEEKVIKTFADQTAEDQRALITTWTLQIYQWLNEARAYVSTHNSILEKISNSLIITKKNNKDEFYLVELEGLKKRRVSKANITSKQILLNGYKLLNEIGETIRGQEITYSITFTSTGEKIINSQAGEVYTIKIPAEEFFNMVSFSESRITLKKPETIYNSLQKNKTKSTIVSEAWSEQKIQNYILFNKQVRENPHWHWSKINEGNMLESYLRFLSNGGTVLEKASKPEYWQSVGHAVSNTMKAPDVFFQGGDIDNEQIKGLNASVANINTMILRLQDLLGVLKTSEVGVEALRPNFKKGMGDAIQKNITMTMDQTVDYLMNYFTSKVDRKVNITKKKN